MAQSDSLPKILPLLHIWILLSDAISVLSVSRSNSGIDFFYTPDIFVLTERKQTCWLRKKVENRCNTVALKIDTNVDHKNTMHLCTQNVKVVILSQLFIFILQMTSKNEVYKLLRGVSELWHLHQLEMNQTEGEITVTSTPPPPPPAIRLCGNIMDLGKKTNVEAINWIFLCLLFDLQS